MAIPQKATGYGNSSTARNVFAATFSTALSSAIKYEMYDGGSFPAVGAAVTVANEIFAGTAGNSTKPMMSLSDTSSATPASTWLPASVTGGGAVLINRMKGQTNFVTSGHTAAGGSAIGTYGTGYSAGAGALSTGSGAAGSGTNPYGVIRWNMALEVPSDATPGSTGQAHDLLLRYTYTGGAPSFIFYFNDNSTGTEGTPLWTAMTSGTNGIRHCRTGSGVGNYLANIPASSVEVTTEGWVTT